MFYMTELSRYLGQTSLVRKDCKLAESIGNSGQKDRVSFASLTHKNNDGRTVGNGDNEIVSGVLREI